MIGLLEKELPHLQTSPIKQIVKFSLKLNFQYVIFVNLT